MSARTEPFIFIAVRIYRIICRTTVLVLGILFLSQYANTKEQKLPKTMDSVALETLLHSDDLTLLLNACRRANLSDDSEAVLRLTSRIETLAQERHASSELLHAYVMAGQHSINLNRNKQGLEYLEQGMRLARELENGWGLATCYMILGIHAISAENDYFGGIQYLLDGLEVAEQYGEERTIAQIACNLSIAYTQRNDPGGLKYAQFAYRYGHEHNYPYMIFSGAYTSAAQLYLAGRYEEALPLIIEAETFLDQFYDQTGVFSTHANILHALHRDLESEQYHRRSMEYIGRTGATSATNAYWCYGDFLIDQKRYTEAIKFLKLGLDISQQTGNRIYRYHLYRCLSEAYKRLGDASEALVWYEAYHRDADSIFSVERERAISEMRVKYETERHEREAQQYETELIREQKRFQGVAFLFVIVAIGLGTTYFIYRRQNRLYLSIVQQNREALQREARLLKQIDVLTRESSGQEKYTNSSLSSEKSDELFERIERLIHEEHLYREPKLTKERLAELVGSNGTYLSQVINTQTGLSVVNYLNKYRIDEAVRLLSDARNDTPLKAIAAEVGFGSLSAFYRLFNERIGMSPSKYREKILQITRDQ